MSTVSLPRPSANTRLSIVARIVEQPANAMADFLDKQALSYAMQSRTMPNSAQSSFERWLAVQIEKLADGARAYDAVNPAQWDEREAIMRGIADSQLRDEGYAAAAHLWQSGRDESDQLLADCATDWTPGGEEPVRD